MNWLAHAFLSEPDVDARLGNLLADLVKRPDRLQMSAAFRDGVRQHEAIDAYTDAHPVVRRSRTRLRGTVRHASGILVDLIYDHFLACDWERYTPTSLDQFTSSLYADIRVRASTFPTTVRPIVERMTAEDWLGSYRCLEGIEVALDRLSARMSARTGLDLDLSRGMTGLVANLAELRSDFEAFFPELRLRFGDMARPKSRQSVVDR